MVIARYLVDTHAGKRVEVTRQVQSVAGIALDTGLRSSGRSGSNIVHPDEIKHLVLEYTTYLRPKQEWHRYLHRMYSPKDRTSSSSS